MRRLIEFFNRKLLVTHIYGIPVRIDYRWFIVIGIMAWFVSVAIPDTVIDGGFLKFLLGLLTVIVFFFSIFIHEAAHAFVARKEGIQVLEILLHPFGGLARLRREPDTPRSEFRIAIAGPIASFLISTLFFGLWAASNSIGTSVLSPLLFALFLLNLLVAVFNLFPGYPLDGGRVLRAFLWKRGKDLNESTALTGKFGQIIAAALIILGIGLIFISSDFFTPLWTIFVGIFLYDSAAKIVRHATNLENLVVEEVMEFPVSIPPGTTVMQFVDNTLTRYKQTVFPVAENKELYGLMILNDLKEKLPRDKWSETEVQDVMRPVREDYFIPMNSRVTDAIALMHANGIGALGVVDDLGELVGFIDRTRLRKRT